jgi:predicted ATPase
MDRLHDFAMAGNMRAIRGEAERLIRDEPHVSAFAEALLALTRNYQSQAILELIEKHKSERVTV